MDLHAAIEGAGGLFNPRRSRQAVGVSKQRVSQLVKRRGFPEPVHVEGYGEVRFGNEADAWPRRRGKIDRQWILDQASKPNMRSALDQYDDGIAPVVEATMRALAIERDYEASDLVHIHQLALLLLRLEVHPESE